MKQAQPVSISCGQYNEASRKTGPSAGNKQRTGLPLAPGLCSPTAAVITAEAQTRPHGKAATVFSERGIGVVIKAKVGGVNLWLFWASGHLWPLFLVTQPQDILLGSPSSYPGHPASLSASRTPPGRARASPAAGSPTQEVGRPRTTMWG